MSHLGGVGLKHILDERLLDSKHLRELALQLWGRPARFSRLKPLGCLALLQAAQRQACMLRLLLEQLKAALQVCRRTRLVSSRLLERGALMTLACSSMVKLLQVKSLSTYCLYSSSTSLWLIAPGLV